MQLVKTLVFLVLATSCASCKELPKHPHEKVFTVFPDQDPTFIGFTSEDVPQGPFELDLEGMRGGTCRPKEDEAKHKMYVFQLEQFALKCAQAAAKKNLQSK